MVGISLLLLFSGLGLWGFAFLGLLGALLADFLLLRFWPTFFCPPTWFCPRLGFVEIDEGFAPILCPSEHEADLAFAWC